MFGFHVKWLYLSNFKDSEKDAVFYFELAVKMSPKNIQLFEKYIKEKSGRDIAGKIFKLSDSNFNDIKNLLFKTLSLVDNPDYTEERKVINILNY